MTLTKGPVENDRSKCGTFYSDRIPDILFFLCTRLPVPHAMPCANLLRWSKTEAMRILAEGDRRTNPAGDGAAARNRCVDLKGI